MIPLTRGIHKFNLTGIKVYKYFHLSSNIEGLINENNIARKICIFIYDIYLC